MTLAIVLTIAAVTVLAVIFRITITRRVQIQASGENPMLIQPVDIEAFRNLVDPAEDAYLRERLPARQFRRVRRCRLLATAAYVKVVSRNAAALVRIGQSAMASADPQVHASARQLVENALMLRRNSTFALVGIYVNLALPANGLTVGRMADTYEKLSLSAMLLGRLQNPSGPVRLSVIH